MDSQPVGWKTIFFFSLFAKKYQKFDTMIRILNIFVYRSIYSLEIKLFVFYQTYRKWIKKKDWETMYFRSKLRFFIHSWENAYKGKRKKWIKWTIHAISRPPWDIAACEGEIRRLESVIRSNKDTTNDVARLYRRSILSRLIFKLIPRKFSLGSVRSWTIRRIRIHWYR